MRSWKLRLLILSSILMLVPMVSDVMAQATDRMSGVALIDYRDKPRFKVGDWVKYHFSSKDVNGAPLENYDLVMIISGEEKFWGDDCFWVETWTLGGKGKGARASAVCMSYSIFGDTAWLPRLKVYHRKFADLDPDYGIYQELMKRSMKYKSTSGPRPSFTLLTDTLGTDTTTVAKGFYRVQKVQRRQGMGTIDENPDSTQRKEDWDRWTLYLSRQVPMTSLVKETHEKWITLKTWAPGHSQEAVEREAFRATGTLELVDFGTGEMIPRVTPIYARGPIFKGKNAIRTEPRKRGG